MLGEATDANGVPWAAKQTVFVSHSTLPVPFCPVVCLRTHVLFSNRKYSHRPSLGLFAGWGRSFLDLVLTLAHFEATQGHGNYYYIDT